MRNTLFGFLILSASMSMAYAQANTRVVMIAGGPSHASGEHEFNAGSILIARALNEQSGLPIRVDVIHNGWPKDESVLEGAAALIIYSDGNSRHPTFGHEETVDRLVDDGHDVTVIDNESANRETFHWNPSPHATKIPMDITARFLPNSYLTQDIDVIFHLAAETQIQPSIEDPIPFNEVNITGTLNILLAAHKTGIKRVVYSASSSAYGNATEFPTPETHTTNPLSPYGLQKYITKLLSRKSNRKILIRNTSALFYKPPSKILRSITIF